MAARSVVLPLGSPISAVAPPICQHTKQNCEAMCWKNTISFFFCLFIYLFDHSKYLMSIRIEELQLHEDPQI